MVNTENIWRQFGNKLLFYIQQKVNNRTDAEDILQDVFLKIHENKAKLNKVEKLPAWIYKVAGNTIIDHYRKKKRSVPAKFHIENESDENPYEQLSCCIELLIEKLSIEEQNLIHAIDLEGQRQVELAEQLQMNYPTLKSKLQRARKKLKAHLLECCIFHLDSAGSVMSYTSKSNGSINT